jgi:hypothetical protein
MVALCVWSSALSILDEEDVYSLKDLQEFLSENGHNVSTQAIYRWIQRRGVPKHGIINQPHSKQNLVCWRGADLKSAMETSNL